MKNIALILSVLFVGAASLWAVPADRRWQTVRQADGSEVRVRLCGDEYGHWFETADGQCYDRGTDGSLRLLSRGELRERRACVLQAMSDVERGTKYKNTLAEAPQNISRSPLKEGIFRGERRGLFILVEFPDVEFSRRDIREVYEGICNTVGYDTYPYLGSVRDYFLEQSDGLFDLTFDIVGPVMADNYESYYGGNSGWGIDGNVSSLVKEVINKVKNTVDFHDYDWNGDGECDQVFLLYAGYGEAQGGPSWTIWPCEGKLSKQLGSNGPMEVDGVTIDTFACSCELNGKEGDHIDGIGTICHEFSHCLGLPDFYNASDMDDYCMITYDVMDLGVYNYGGYCPCGYTGWERWYCGWRDLVVLDEPQAIDNWQSLTEGGATYIIRNDGDRKGNEYYVLDNRQFVGFDQYLYSAGMVVMHVDYDATAWAENKVNTDKKHQRFMLVAADNMMDFATSDTDAFPYTYMNGQRTLDSLTNNTHPRTTTFVKNKDGKNLLNKPVYDIRQHDDGLMSFGFMMHNVPPVPEEPTGIVDIQQSTAYFEQSPAVYDLQGRLVSRGDEGISMKKGVYVVNGKKIINQ